MNRSSKWIGTALAAVVAAGLIAGTGCQQTKKFLNRDSTLADVEIDGEMYTVESSTSDAGRVGVAHLRAHEYADAITSLKTAVAAKPDDEKSTKALAIAYDLSGDKANAKTYYSKANLLMHEPDPLVTKRLADLNKVK